MRRLPPAPLIAAIVRSLVVVSERHPVVIAVVVFGQISVQMLLAAVLIDTLHAALED